MAIRLIKKNKHLILKRQIRKWKGGGGGGMEGGVGEGGIS